MKEKIEGLENRVVSEYAGGLRGWMRLGESEEEMYVQLRALSFISRTRLDGSRSIEIGVTGPDKRLTVVRFDEDLTGSIAAALDGRIRSPDGSTGYVDLTGVSNPLTKEEELVWERTVERVTRERNEPPIKG